MAFTLLGKLIQNSDPLPDVVIREQNVQTIQQLEDSIEFFKADLFILDQQLEEYESFKKVLEQYNCNFVEIVDDVKAVIPVIVEKYGVEVKQEEKEIYYEKTEKSKVVIQEKIIEKEVIRTAYTAIPSKVIVVGSLYRGAGSTLLATNLARMIGERGIDVSYVEHPLIKPYMFDYLQIHADEEKEYFDIAREIHLEGLARSKRSEWVQNKVKWHVIDSRKPQLPSFTYENLLVLLHAIQSSVMIVDISDRWLDPEIEKYLRVADFIYLCVEPDPIKYDWVLYEQENNSKENMIMKLLNEPDIEYELVNMKYIKSIDVKSWNEMLQRKPIAKIPFMPYEDVQGALYKSKLLYDYETYNELLDEVLMPLIVKVVPKDFLEIRKKESTFLKKLFKR